MLPLKSGIKEAALTYRIVTPLFMGGANQADPPALRIASIKGVLRFWWRAIHYWPLYKQSGSDATTTLKKLHREEARLFGQAADDANPNAGQGCVLLRLSVSDDLRVDELPCKKFSERSYMLGMGLFDSQTGKVSRKAILDGTFTLNLLFKPGTTEADRLSVIKAAYCLGLVGGLGARSRHGWGSIALVSMEGASEFSLSLPQNTKEYATLLQSFKLEADASAPIPEITAFSPRCQWLPGINKSTALEVLDEIGFRMGTYRGYGRNDMVFGHRLEKNNKRFTDDHDNMLNLVNDRNVNTHPRRLIFGMPHNYFFSSNNKKVNIQKTRKYKLERRSSPLFIHIHPVGNQYCGLQLVMPACFLPQDEQVMMEAGQRSQCVDIKPDWNIFTEYLEAIKKIKK